MSNSVLPRILLGAASLGVAAALAVPALGAASTTAGHSWGDARPPQVVLAGHSWGDAKPPSILRPAGHSWGDAKPPSTTTELSPAGHSWGDSKPVESPELIPAGA